MTYYLAAVASSSHTWSFISDGRFQVHRGQGRFPEVLQQDVGQATRAAHVCQRRRRGLHDLQAEAGLRVRVHVQAAEDVPGRRSLQRSE